MTHPDVLWLAQGARRLACVVGGVFVVLVVILVIAEGGEPFRRADGAQRRQLLYYSLLTFAVLIAWWSDLLGAAVLALALLACTVTEWRVAGTLPGGSIQFLWLLPALHAVAAAWGEERDGAPRARRRIRRGR